MTQAAVTAPSEVLAGTASVRGFVLFGVLFVFALFAAGCRDAVAPPPASTRAPQPLGLVEVTVSGLGTERLSARAEVPVPARSGARRSLSAPANGDASGTGSIQLEQLGTGSFTEGTRGTGGYRYLWATFRVRNAQSDSTPYNTPRQNLTFFAVATPTTLGGTAISTLQRFDGSAASSGIAAQVLPTGAVHQQSGTRVPTEADVLQIVTDGEANAVAAPVGVTVLPYGFVAHNAATGGRTLAASPGASQYDGVVTFAFKVPLQSSAAADPFTISAIFLAMDDSEKRITQSLEEQNTAGEAAFLARAAAIGATIKTVLPGTASYAGDAATTRTLCTVRTAGPNGGATAELVHRDVASVTLADPFPGWPLSAGGSVARDLNAAARNAGGVAVADVPLQLTYGTPGVVTPWNLTGVRMLPRLNRASTTVSASACGKSSGTITVSTTGFVSVGAGRVMSLALKSDGTVAAWGSNVYHQLDLPSGLGSVAQVAAGEIHAFALRVDGTLVPWGQNGSGSDAFPPALTGLVQFSANNAGGIAVKSDGTVVAWGRNDFGQAVPPSGLRDAVQGASGNRHFAVLRSDGTVVAWGFNPYGQATVPPGLVNVVQVATGDNFSLALRSDGTVVAWGLNDNGETIVPPGLANVVQISAGQSHAAALRSDGTVVVWGDNTFGQRDVPPGLTGVVQLSVGTANHVLALKSDGTVVGWGYNDHGERTVPPTLTATVP